ncbi:hypothetical protein ASD79_10060 [Caulobacter sp. Root655]|uniref:pentapeptide repeat-containing protein n=1 Tax=Caulobacter sp. Root655 TaxID=1736578 RepID=UPI0006FD8233|nr:pentapeptide repeat-containing protein [Caulobacter sp. Root655]KRA59871.1 hypothetical protein ASD79_10060 [Caulobacter sp. Root655]
MTAKAADRPQFAGKIAYASTGARTAWLNVVTRRDGNETTYLPMMTGKGEAAAFPCIAYALPEGGFQLQLKNLMWIALSPLGYLVLVADIAQAAPLRLAGSPLGQGWEIKTPNGYLPVGYYPDLTEPVLTTNLDDATTSFAPTLITPSVADLVAAGSGRGVDLTHVRLDGANLPKVDLTGAHFDDASLVGATLTGCALTGATFVGADLSGVRFDGSRLDSADMTRATLAAPSWGAPLSAKGLVLAQCHAAGAILGGQKDKLDCTEAILTEGDFTDADLTGWQLGKAKAGRAVLVRTDLTSAMLDGADLSNVVALGGVFRRASMRNVRGQSANFTNADLSGADLGQAQLGARAFLFEIASSLAKDLDGNAYPNAAVIAAFTKQGVTLSPQAPIMVITRGERWEIDDPRGPYVLIVTSAGIQVFLAAADMTPATLAGALCLSTKAPGAGLSGADLRGVRWYGSGATLDHADLEGAYLSQALCASTDFTQAFLSGCDFSGSVLVQAVFRGCQIGLGASRQPLSLQGAQLQGADFTNANLLGVLLTDAGVALAQGVPLFTLPASDAAYLTPEGLPTLAPVFDEAGYPLGTDPTVTAVKGWTINNSSDPIPSNPRRYLVRTGATDLKVFDGLSNTYYFALPASFAVQLAKPNPASLLIQAFSKAGYGLVATAGIAPISYWTLKAGADAMSPLAFAYSQFTITPGDPVLTVLGSTLLRMRDWPQYPGGLAFAATNAIQGALNPASIGPSGLPMAWVAAGKIDWTSFLIGT